MEIGKRLRQLRESKNLSQGDVEKRTGLLRVYISRVENGHTVPSVATLEKMARALEVPMYRLFHDGEVPSSIRTLTLPKDKEEWGNKRRRSRLSLQVAQATCENATRRPKALAAHGPKSRKTLAPNPFPTYRNFPGDRPCKNLCYLAAL